MRKALEQKSIGFLWLEVWPSSIFRPTDRGAVPAVVSKEPTVRATTKLLGEYTCHVHRIFNPSQLSYQGLIRIVRGTSVRYGPGRGGFSLCHPAVTPASGELFAVPPCPV